MDDHGHRGSVALTDFADVEQFARQHGVCGGLTPRAMAQPDGGGYLLTIACVCGATFNRWVSPEDARRPLPIPSRAPKAPPASPPTPPPAPVVPVMPAPVVARPVPRPSDDLEALVQGMRAAEEAATVSPAPEHDAPPERESAPEQALAREPVPATPSPASPPPIRAAPVPSPADTTIRSAPPQAGRPAMALSPRHASRGRAVWLVLFLIVGLAAAGVIYVAGGPDAPLMAPFGSPSPLPTDPQHPALEATVKTLRELHSVATSTTSVSAYSTRATSARADIERFLAARSGGANRAHVREALDMHLLAASAWHAKSLDRKEAWEAIGLDPVIDLCPPLRLVADAAVQPAHVSRAQTRGVAVASALPLLWECADERIAALEQGLAGR